MLNKFLFEEALGFDISFSKSKCYTLALPAVDASTITSSCLRSALSAFIIFLVFYCFYSKLAYYFTDFSNDFLDLGDVGVITDGD